MKSIPFAFAVPALIAAATTGVGQTTSTTTATNATNANQTVVGASARDGFTLRGTELVMTRNGVTTKVDREMRLSNGTRVLANGNILAADGSSTSLRANQLLTFDGAFQDVILTPQGVAPISSVDPGSSSAPAKTNSVGISSRDGISISGADVFLTRNGVTEKVSSDVRLPNGMVVKPNGTVISGSGNSITLRPNQVVDLNGVLHDAAAGR